MEEVTLNVELASKSISGPAPAEVDANLFHRRLLHCARYSHKTQEPFSYEHVVWRNDEPGMIPIIVQPDAPDGIIARVGEPRRFDPEVAFGALALEVLRSINVVVLLTETEPSHYPGPRVLYANDAFERMTGFSVSEVVGRTPRILQGPDTSDASRKKISEGLTGWSRIHVEIQNYKKDGTPFLVELDISPITDASGWYTYWCSLQRDITETRRLDAERQQQLKLESIGQLAAGVAHEINTPVQYVNDNVTFLNDVVPPMLDAAACLQTMCEHAQIDAATLERGRTILERLELDFTREELPRALDQCSDGLQRVSRIVGAMKEFSHPSSDTKQPENLHAIIDTTLTVSRNEWKYVAEVETCFLPELPNVPCFRDEMSQVFLNLIVNAAHAIADNHETTDRGSITITTALEGDHAVVSIADDGPGIPEAIRQRVFDPFFTTKEVGKGTGQGLAISRSVIVKKHGGALNVSCPPSGGTVFEIRLPLTHERHA